MARSGMRIKANSDVESQKPFILPMRYSPECRPDGEARHPAPSAATW